jgi:hypothetical protein
MAEELRTEKLLEEIRDAQRELLAEYGRVTQQSLELQQRAVARQEQLGGVSKRLALVGAALVTALLCLLVYLLVRWAAALFG